MTNTAAAARFRLRATPTPLSSSASFSASPLAALTAVLSSGHPASTTTSPSIFPRALRAAADLRLPGLGLQLHALLAKTGLLDDPFSSSALLLLYATLASLPRARLLFDRIPKSASPVPWNTMIIRYAQDGFLGEAFELMTEMVECGVPVGTSTWNAVIAGCVRAREGALAVGLLGEMGAGVLRELHGFVLRNTEIVGFGPVDLDRLKESLAAGYMRSCFIEYADRVFQDVRFHSRWSSLRLIWQQKEAWRSMLMCTAMV
ncbi:hypothetical protein E2562_034576 [Oryza meyeriana var. granulata]|uniref:Pentacotripeptide-repeat region of PRORP domain-containing protein n=1 Tax=Oryza meyeriana var. granulata TaxID=110450 RepID=A0A6G1ESL2_9ORYZ|nr:hypothetical protein E2562_034576 [Oryza meyeriana var. granulata]